MPTFLKVTKAHVKRIFNNFDSWVDVLRIDEYSAIGNPAATELSATAGDVTTDIPAYQGATYTLNWQDDPANVVFPQDSLNTNRKTDEVKVKGPDPGPDFDPLTNTITVLAIKKTQVKDSLDPPGYQQPFWSFKNLSSDNNNGRKVLTVRVPHTDLDPALEIGGSNPDWATYLAAMQFNSQDTTQFVDVEIVQSFGTFSSIDDWQVSVNSLKNQNQSIAALFPPGGGAGVRLDPFQCIVNCHFEIETFPVAGFRFYLSGAVVNAGPATGPFINNNDGSFSGDVPGPVVTFTLTGPYLSLDRQTSITITGPSGPGITTWSGVATLGIEPVADDPGAYNTTLPNGSPNPAYGSLTFAAFTVTPS